LERGEAFTSGPEHQENQASDTQQLLF